MGILLLVGSEAARRQAGGLAGAAVLFEAVGAAEKQGVAVHAGTVIVGFGGGLAMVASADDGGLFGAERNGEPIVEDKKLAFPVGAPLLQAVADHTAVQLIDFFKARLF